MINLMDTKPLPEPLLTRYVVVIAVSEAPVVAPKAKKYESYNAETYKSDEVKKDEVTGEVVTVDSLTLRKQLVLEKYTIKSLI